MGPGHQYSNFQSRAATDDAGELNRSSSMLIEEQESPSSAERLRPAGSSAPPNPYEPATNNSTPPPREHAFTKRLLHTHQNDGADNLGTAKRRSASKRRKAQSTSTGEDSLMVQMHNEVERKKANGDPAAPKPGLGPRPTGSDEKLDMLSGVYVPTCLNVLSILMFLRFGFILG